MANDEEKNQLKELQETADLVETPFETEEEVTIIDDSLLEQGVTFKKVTKSEPQPDGTVRTVVEERRCNDRLIRCFGCKRLLPRAKAGVFNRRYYCKKDFPYRQFYFKKFFGFFTREEGENAGRRQEEVVKSGSISKNSGPRFEPRSPEDDKKSGDTIQ